MGTPNDFNLGLMMAVMLFIVSAGYILLIFLTFTSERKTKMRQSYILVGFLLWLNGFSYALMTLAENETLIRIYWAIGFISLCLFFPAWLVFLSTILKTKYKYTKIVLRTAFCLTTAFALIGIFFGGSSITQTGFGNQFSYQGCWFFKVLFFYLATFLVIMLFGHIKWYLQTELKGYRNHILLINIQTVSVAIIAFSTDFIIPTFTEMTITPLSSAAALVVAVQVYASRKKYKTFGITTSSIADYIFTSVEIPIYVLDHKNKIVAENSAAVDFMGGSIVESNIADYILMDDKTLCDQFLSQNITNETITVETPAGTRICNMVLTVEHDKYNDAICKIAILRDITAERQAQEFEKARDAARAANQAKSDFLASMSHEIRTPMNAIMGITEILLQSEHPKETEEGLIKVFNSSNLLLGIINDILDFSKIEAGKMDILPASYKTASLIHDSAHLNMGKANEKSIRFELEIDKDMPANLIGDELRIKQLLNNLLSNAFKYTDIGTVTLSAKYEDALLILRVEDTGLGMSKEQLSTLFSEYSRFHEETSSEEGTGLGLAITQNLVRLMDGEILVESEPGVGSVFTIKVPQPTADDEVLGEELAESLRRFRMEDIKGRERRHVVRDIMSYGRVLIVDDMEPNLYVAEGLIKPYKIQTETAMRGLDAIKKIKEGNVYDLIFMDHMMPGMDGIETTKQLRELGYNGPIVALTANALKGQADIFMQNGFNDFISKPIDIRQLDIVLNKFVRVKEGTKTIETAPIQTEMPPIIAMLKKIDGFNVDDALTTMGGQYDVYESTVRLTARLLPSTIEKIDKYLAEDDIARFTTEVHGLRGVFNNIGATTIGSAAARLENAALDGQKDFCCENYPPFKEMLTIFLNQYNEVISSGSINEKEKIEKDVLQEALKTAKTAVEDYDAMQALGILKPLTNYSYNDDIDKFLEKAVFYLEEFKFQEAVENISIAEKALGDV
ncbi:MAG: ATP-binding protein [Defluviitaleaceae bacterium]|nr:ATP-binding protein [Defluviitaleaceae bacterium]